MVAAPEFDPFEARYVEAMRAELPFAPFHFDGWPAYERARPLMGTGDPLQLVAAWPDDGWTVHYRPLLNEVIGTLQTPIDRQPQIVVFGAADHGPDWVEDLVRRNPRDPAIVVEQLHQLGNRGTIPPPEPLGLGDVGLPGQPDTYVRHIDGLGTGGEDLVATAYRIAGERGLRLGPPVGTTDSGHPVFEPVSTTHEPAGSPLRIALVPSGNGTSTTAVHMFAEDRGTSHWTKFAELASIDSLDPNGGSGLTRAAEARREAVLQPCRRAYV